MKLSFVGLLLLGSSALVFASDAPDASKRVGGGCDGCKLMLEGMPQTLASQTIIMPVDGGEPLEVEGVIFQEDGKTPAPSVILYVYHTDAKGFYSPAPGQTVARRHGGLRGWMQTDANGRYKFRTIRPAPYPNRHLPAHIHAVVKEPGKNEYYIDDFLFDDDPLLTREKRTQDARGGSGIVQATRNANGVWIARRDLVLGRNIPHYH
ncbi:MAG: intradiol ring-cleavage dioxygenase [Chthoniobacterales bacterium]|nr:intradiol ring-cleavage dioxygenase [Chthoniobacterales bacterium]